MLCGLAVASTATAHALNFTLGSRELRRREERCIDCTTSVLANPGWANGQLWSGPFAGTKTGNWQLSANLGGQTELRTDSATSENYLWNFCAHWSDPDQQTACTVWIGQVVTPQANVAYQFEWEYQITGAAEIDPDQEYTTYTGFQIYIGNMDGTEEYFSVQHRASNTPDGEWVKFTSKTFQLNFDHDKDVIAMFTAVNDDFDTEIKVKGIKQVPQLCRDPDFVPFCPAPCIDCQTPMLANPGWANGELSNGDLSNPTKSGNWLLGGDIETRGDLELRPDPDFPSTYYVYNFCPTTMTSSYYCLIYLGQVVTLEAGVEYELDLDYRLSNVRPQDRAGISLLVLTIDDQFIFEDHFYSGDTTGDQWSHWTSQRFQVQETGDYVIRVDPVNDPNDGVLMMRDIKQTPVLCKDPEFVPYCPGPSSSVVPSSSAAPSSSSALPSSSAILSSSAFPSSAPSVIPSSSAAPSSLPSSIVPSSLAISSSVPSVTPSSSAAPSSPPSSAMSSSSAVPSLPSSVIPSSSAAPSSLSSSIAPSSLAISSLAIVSSAIPSSLATPSSSIAPVSSAAPSSSRRPCRRRSRSSSPASSVTSSAPAGLISSAPSVVSSAPVPFVVTVTE